MSYDLYIHRRGNWWEKGDDIQLEEWKTYCDADPTLELRGEVTGRDPVTNKTMQIASEGLAFWDGESFALFDLLDGNIAVSGDDDMVIAKALLIASALSARVQNDRGEFY